MIRSGCRLIAALAFAGMALPVVAAAEPAPIAVLVGPEVRVPLSDPDIGYNFRVPDDGSAPVGALGATVAYRLPHHLAIGVRGAASWRRYKSALQGTVFGQEDSYRAIPIDVALAVQYEPGRILNREVSFAPWLGRRYTWLSTAEAACTQRNFPTVTWTCGTPMTTTAWRPHETMAGLTAAIDVLGPGPDRLAVVLDVQLGAGDGSAIGFGVAYRR